MIVEARLEVLPGDILPVYRFDSKSEVRGYSFKKRAWLTPRLLLDDERFIALRLSGTKNRLMEEAVYGSQEEAEAMILEAIERSPSFTFFAFICFERQTVGMWSANGELFDRAADVRGSPEEVARGLFSLAVAASVIGG